MTTNLIINKLSKNKVASTGATSLNMQPKRTVSKMFPKQLSGIILTLSFFVAFTSCNKLLDVPPPISAVTEDFIYSSNGSATAVLTDIYALMNGSPFQGGASISLFAGLASDEYKLESSPATYYVGYYTNNLSLQPPISGTEHWAPLYNYVFKCNAAIEGISNSATLNTTVKNQLLGEAKFMRAFLYFHLVNMYGDVPLAITADPLINSKLARASKISVFAQIIADLKEAEGLLSDNYLDGSLFNPTTERVRPTKWAATALLARVYLYNSDWANAETQSTLVINNTTLFSLKDSLNDVFLKNSREAIWQIQPVAQNFNTSEALALIIQAAGPGASQPVQLSSQLLNSFDADDKRAAIGKWITKVTVGGTSYYSPFKYKINSPAGSNAPINNTTGTKNMSEYYMVLRLAEQYLIRAEARAHLSNVAGAQSDLNAIRNRAGLSNTSANDQTSLLAAILNERQHELFSEWGHRWFDLKRTNNIDAVMTIVTPQKSAGTTNWRSFQKYFPIPAEDILKNPNLVQTTGY